MLANAPDRRTKPVKVGDEEGAGYYGVNLPHQFDKTGGKAVKCWLAKIINQIKELTQSTLQWKTNESYLKRRLAILMNLVKKINYQNIVKKKQLCVTITYL